MKLQLTKQFQKAKFLNLFLSNHTCISLASCALVILWVGVLFFAVPLPALAAEIPTTLVLPLKINSPDDKESLTGVIDTALLKALASTPSGGNAFKVMNRAEAESIFDYDTAWPPASEAIKDFHTKIAHDYSYIAAGSLTKLGETISIDIKVFDLLDPSSPTFYYLGGQEPGNIDVSMEKITHDILSYTSRSFLVASIAPKGTKELTAGLF